MNVSLTPELEKFVENEVKGGLYQTASEVVRAGLRRLREDQQQMAVSRTLEELEAHLLGCIERMDQGEGIDGEKMFRRLRKKIQDRQSRG